jgi:hypothetical protein
MVGWSLSAVIVVSLVSIGLGAFVAPRWSSAQYGIVLDDPRALAFIRAMGVRDVVIGGLLGLIAWQHARQTLGLGMALTAVIAVTDLVLVIADRRTATAQPTTRALDAARVLHAAGVVGLVLTGTVLLAGY